jgi:hypothetical protein
MFQGWVFCGLCEVRDIGRARREWGFSDVNEDDHKEDDAENVEEEEEDMLLTRQQQRVRPHGVVEPETLACSKTAP